MMPTLDLTTRIALWIVPVIFAITLHEVAHGFTAYYFGDSTAKRLNRLSLNPIRHVDPIGSFLVPSLLLWIGGFMFGWAKPVPINPLNLKRPRHNMIFVAAAGPFANFVMATFWALIFKLGIVLNPSSITLSEIFIYTGAAGVLINSAIMMLNLLPLLPLDGGRMVNGLLPAKISYYFSKSERLGLPILLILILTGSLQPILNNLILFSVHLFSIIAQISQEQLGLAFYIMLGH